MKVYFTSLRLDPVFPDKPESELLHFSIVADDIMIAAKHIACYCRGRFEASGRGAEVLDLSTSKTRGVQYRGL